MPVFKIVAQEEAISVYEKVLDVEADSLEEALEIAKEEADMGFWEGWAEIGEPIINITVFQAEEDYE